MAALGYRVLKVTIRRGGNTDGRMHGEGPLSGMRLDKIGSVQTRLHAEGAIMVCLAGRMAQKMAFPLSVRRWQSRLDDEDATVLAWRFCTSVPETKAFLKWLEIRTQQRLNAHWKTVELIANALLARRRLSGKEFEELIRPRRCGLLPNILQVDREHPTAHQ